MYNKDDMLEAFIEIYLRNPQIEDKHTAVANELGISRNEAKEGTYRLIYTHPSLMYLMNIGEDLLMFKLGRQIEQGVNIENYLEEVSASLEYSAKELREGRKPSWDKKLHIQLEVKKNRADTHI